jgi:2-haloacid dehalogenase
MARAWIDRRFGMTEAGATPWPAQKPAVDFHFKALAEFVAAHRAEAKAEGAHSE